MRAGFAGTPEFAVRALAALHGAGFTIPVVLTQPDRPSGRGMAVRVSPVKQFAVDHGLCILQPPTLRTAEAQAALRKTPLDVLVVAAYGLILPQAVLDWPRFGCLNIHASLLPRWRGAAPIARAIEAGDRESGITIMQMDAGLDTGPIVLRQSLPIGPRETAGSLHDRLADLGAGLCVEALRTLEREGRMETRPQPSDRVTYAAKIERADTQVDWTRSAEAIDRQVRAFAPAPGAVAAWQGAPVKIRIAQPIDGRADGAPGTIISVSREGIDVVCGLDAIPRLLRLVELQPAAGRPMPASAFAAGRGVAPGGRFSPGNQVR
jgi:methionyl-tRNA formyltransferase